MPQLEVTIVGKNNNKAIVTGDNALLVEVANPSGGGGTQSVEDVNSAAILQNLSDILTIESQNQTLLNDVNNNIAELKGFAIPTIERTATTGSSSNNLVSISFANTGAANGTILGTILKPGESVTFDAGNRFYSSGQFSWDATGTEFLITTLSKL